MHQILKVADFSCLPPIFHIEKMEQQNGFNKNKSNFQQRKKIPLNKFHVEGDGLSPGFFSPFFSWGWYIPLAEGFGHQFEKTPAFTGFLF